MNEFYIFTNFVKAQDFTTASFYDENELKKYAKQPFGSKKNTWDSTILLTINNKIDPADYFYCGPLIIVSIKLFTLLNSYAENGLLEFLPVKVLFKNKIMYNHGVLNFTEELDALDKEKSDIIDDDGFIDIQRLVLNKDKIDHRKVFYIEGSNHAITVDKEVKEKIISEKIRGVNLKKPEDWRPY